MQDLFPVLAAIGYLFIFLGLVGAVVPVLPGPVFIWIGTFLWAWGDGFARIGWPTLLLLGVLTVIAWGSDLALTALTSRRSGTGWRSIGVAILGGLAGAAVLSVIPIIGTVIGALLGAVTGLWYMEYQEKGDREAATRAVRAYLGGFLLAMLVELGIAILMITIFATQAFL
ncbi:MAG: DUF456 domain-containing protein [Caldilineaceae bacterium]|nr:DUF456 domain-containing protein [Caldilineaceae bacterium]